VEPNPAHLALARLEDAVGDELLVVTQNVDDLHERAGSRRVLHMHGELRAARCVSCGARSAWVHDLADHPPCPRCHSCDLRPDVVWFGEVPHHLDRIFDRLTATDLFVSVGTSGAVYPAAGFVQEAGRSGARTLELNLEPSAGSHLFDEARHGPASVLVPAWVEELLGSAGRGR
jgi:NAD-dependent deacetylase